MVLSDGVITLRRAAEADVPALVAACQDPEIPRWTAVPSPYTEDDARAFLTTLPEDRFLIVDADDRLLGAISLHNADTEPEIGYWLAADARGQGAATRAVRLLRDWAVREHGAGHVLLAIHRDNAASQRVAERAGFTDTGRRRPSRHSTDGEADHAVYAWTAEAQQ